MKNRRTLIPTQVTPSKPFCPATPAPLPPPPPVVSPGLDIYASDTAEDDWPLGTWGTAIVLVMLVFWPLTVMLAPVIWLIDRLNNGARD